MELFKVIIQPQRPRVVESWHQLGVLPSFAGGEWTGNCDMYCDRRSIDPGQPALEVAAQLQASGNSSCFCCIYNRPSSLISHLVGRVVLHYTHSFSLMHCTPSNSSSPPPLTTSLSKRSWWYLVSFNLIMIPLAMQKEEMQIADKTEWGGGRDSTFTIYIFIQYILQYSRELFTETARESTESAHAC